MNLYLRGDDMSVKDAVDIEDDLKNSEEANTGI